jgi:hypothetical protein
MTDIYTKYHRKIQKMIDEKNFELAKKILLNMKKKAMTMNSQYGLKECKKLKKKIDDEIIYENALKIFNKAEIEYKNKNYITALNLYKKGRDGMIKSEIMRGKFIEERLSKINYAIYDIINKKIKFENVVDWLLKEKDDEKFNELINMLGKIVRKKLEFIAPAIDIFLKMVDSKEKDTRFRGIKGLGEIAVQRPGWAYIGIKKLVELSREDDLNDARIMALMELSRIGQVNSTMLVEHVEPIIDSLRDRDQNVRSWAAITIGLMAEAIPVEAKEAIPALREALHDESLLVQQYAYKALELIRATMK